MDAVVNLTYLTSPELQQNSNCMTLQCFIFDVLQMTQMPGHKLEPVLEPKKVSSLQTKYAYSDMYV